MHINAHHLDVDTLRRLQDIEANSGQGTAGVFYSRSLTAPSPSAGWVWFMLGGLGCLAVAAFLFRATLLETVPLLLLGLSQAGLLGLGTFLLLLGAIRLCKPTESAQGSFLYADARCLWIVEGDCIETQPLHNLAGVEVNDVAHSALEPRLELILSLPSGKRTLVFNNKPAADQFARFLANLPVNSSDEALPEPQARRRAIPLAPLVAACVFLVAVGLLPGYNESRLDERLFAKIPTESSENIKPIDIYLSKLPTGKHADEVRKMRDDRLFVSACRRLRDTDNLTEMNAYLADPDNTLHRDEVPGVIEQYLFRAIPVAPSEDLTAIDRYLRELPRGKRVTRVRDLREDRIFQRAERLSANDLGELRKYLAQANYKRHRKEAQGILDRVYDREIARIRGKLDNTKIKVDSKILEAVVALLETLKRSASPVVPVGFLATQDDEPTSELLVKLEQLTYDDYVKKHKELASIASTLPGSKAILPRGDLFSLLQTRRRESVILTRLQDAVSKGIRKDIIHLVAADEKLAPILTVAYHVLPRGSLYLYSTNPAGIKEEPKIHGLLRSYEVKWTLTVRPPGKDTKPTSFALDSRALKDLTYFPKTGDPTWAPYAVILYSAFYDLSSQFIHSFGFDPGQPPARFTFAEVSGVKEEEELSRQNSGN